jgi:hypothetical protein
VDRVTKESRELISGGGDSIGGPVFSPDDRTLYFNSTHSESDIWMIPLPYFGLPSGPSIFQSVEI